MKFALIGHPVSHSLSPVIHQAAYRELGVSHEYGLIDAPDEAAVDGALADLRRGELAGLNVTIPWKRRAFALSQRRSPLAERLQVANVLALVGSEIMAHNTDALALESEFGRLVSGPRALVIGSGGAAPAVVAACAAAGIHETYVTARRFTNELPREDWPGAKELSTLGARLLPWPASSVAARAELDALCAETALFVQCTSAGMQGADSGEPIAELVPWARTPQNAIAYDLIYAPLCTPFLREAQKAGRRTSHGLPMLVGQAALAIEIWLGQRPKPEPLLEAALSALAKRGRS
ncbi:MAG: shikimate dehydrogenase [Myxococcales bacterium]|nr:MAG: shikimate dehydrogenase [Myxococcales bacterium]